MTGDIAQARLRAERATLGSIGKAVLVAGGHVLTTRYASRQFSPQDIAALGAGWRPLVSESDTVFAAAEYEYQGNSGLAWLARPPDSDLPGEDNPEVAAAIEAFDRWRLRAVPAAVAAAGHGDRFTLRVHVCRRAGAWLAGSVRPRAGSPRSVPWDLFIDGLGALADLPGLHGSPVIDDSGGGLLGLAYSAYLLGGKYNFLPLHLCLPVGVLNEIRAAQANGFPGGESCWLASPTGAVAELLGIMTRAGHFTDARSLLAAASEADEAARNALLDLCSEAAVPPELLARVRAQLQVIHAWPFEQDPSGGGTASPGHFQN